MLSWTCICHLPLLLLDYLLILHLIVLSSIGLFYFIFFWIICFLQMGYMWWVIWVWGLSPLQMEMSYSRWTEPNWFFWLGLIWFSLFFGWVHNILHFWYSVFLVWLHTHISQFWWGYLHMVFTVIKLEITWIDLCVYICNLHSNTNLINVSLKFLWSLFNVVNTIWSFLVFLKYLFVNPIWEEVQSSWLQNQMGFFIVRLLYHDLKAVG